MYFSVEKLAIETVCIYFTDFLKMEINFRGCETDRRSCDLLHFVVYFVSMVTFVYLIWADYNINIMLIGIHFRAMFTVTT